MLPVLLDLLLDKSAARISEATASTTAQDSVLLAVGLAGMLLLLVPLLALDTTPPRSLRLVRQAYSAFPRDVLLKNSLLVEEYAADSD